MFSVRAVVSLLLASQARAFSRPALRPLRAAAKPCRSPPVRAVDLYDVGGTQVTFDHVAAGLMGTEATVEVEVIEVTGRNITCLVSVSDELELLGHGTHTRAIVNAQHTKQRLLAKQAKIDSTADG